MYCLEAISGIGAVVNRINRHKVTINGSMIGEVSVDYEYTNVSELLIICWVRFLENIKKQKYRFQAGATSAAGPLTSI